MCDKKCNKCKRRAKLTRSVVRKLEAKAKMYHELANTMGGTTCTHREMWLACENATVAAAYIIYVQELYKGSK